MASHNRTYHWTGTPPELLKQWESLKDFNSRAVVRDWIYCALTVGVLTLGMAIGHYFADRSALRSPVIQAFWFGFFVVALGIVKFNFPQLIFIRPKVRSETKEHVIDTLFFTVLLDVPVSSTLTLSFDLGDYRDTKQWLLLTGTLANGHAYKLTMSDKGRMKTKYKKKWTLEIHRIRSSVRLQIKLPKSFKHPVQPILTHLQANVPSRNGMVAKTQAKNRLIDVKWTAAEPMPYLETQPNVPTGIKNKIAPQMFMWIYQAMAKAQKSSQATV